MEKVITYSVDTETTGLKPETAEILQLAIVDENGVEIFNEYFCPSYHLAWNEAEKVNHITPEMVAGKPTIKERLADINAILARCNAIVGYNTGFDLSFLKDARIEIPGNIRVIDVQQMYMGVVADYGEWNWEHNCPKWRSLKECAEFCNYEWQGEAHDSLEDARSAMACYQWLSDSMYELQMMLLKKAELHFANKTIMPLKRCPFCGSELRNTAGNLRCKNQSCEASFVQYKGHWHCMIAISRAFGEPFPIDSKFSKLEKEAQIQMISDAIKESRNKVISALNDPDVIVTFSETERVEDFVRTMLKSSDANSDRSTIENPKISIWRLVTEFAFKARMEVEQQNGQD